jgi:hypothetical protein
MRAICRSPAQARCYFSAHDPSLRARVDRPDLEQGFRGVGEIFGDEVMAAALIDGLVHHCHLVTIRGNGYRVRQHTELWQTLLTAHEPESSGRRGRRTSSSGGHDELRLVPSSTRRICTRRNCQIFNRRGQRVRFVFETPFDSRSIPSRAVAPQLKYAPAPSRGGSNHR